MHLEGAVKFGSDAAQNSSKSNSPESSASYFSMSASTCSWLGTSYLRRRPSSARRRRDPSAAYPRRGRDGRRRRSLEPPTAGLVEDAAPTGPAGVANTSARRLGHERADHRRDLVPVDRAAAVDVHELEDDAQVLLLEVAERVARHGAASYVWRSPCFVGAALSELPLCPTSILHSVGSCSTSPPRRARGAASSPSRRYYEL